MAGLTQNPKYTTHDCQQSCLVTVVLSYSVPYAGVFTINVAVADIYMSSSSESDSSNDSCSKENIFVLVILLTVVYHMRHYSQKICIRIKCWIHYKHYASRISQGFTRFPKSRIPDFCGLLGEPSQKNVQNVKN